MVEGSFPRRLSERRGLAQDDGPFEGVPLHLHSAFKDWARSNLGRHWREYQSGDEQLAARKTLAVRCRVPVMGEAYLATMLALADQKHGRVDQFLDVVDLHLQLYGAGHDELCELLLAAGSVWTVVDDPRRLERRVPEEEHELYERATTPGDDAAEQLREAWGKVYGRNPDPSDAWDHAIKAVEILLQPIALPANDKATLGSMLAALEAKPEKWTLTLASSSKTVGPVETLTAMLRLIWPNPDRHGSRSGSSRTPTREEAEQVVGLAVLLVSWLRKGALQPAAASSTGP